MTHSIFRHPAESLVLLQVWVARTWWIVGPFFLSASLGRLAARSGWLMAGLESLAMSCCTTLSLLARRAFVPARFCSHRAISLFMSLICSRATTSKMLQILTKPKQTANRIPVLFMVLPMVFLFDGAAFFWETATLGLWAIDGIDGLRMAASNLCSGTTIARPYILKDATRTKSRSLANLA